MHQQRGFTIIELMLASLLGLVLMGGVLQIFSSSRSAYALQENLAVMQENGRFTLDFIQRDLRMTNFRGCANINRTNLDNRLSNPAQVENAFAIGLEGWDDVSSGSPPAGLPGTIAPASDVLVLRGPAGLGFPDPVARQKGLIDHALRLDRIDSAAGYALIADELPERNNRLCPNGSAATSGLCVNDVVLVQDCISDPIVVPITTLSASAGEVTINHGTGAIELTAFANGGEVHRLSTRLYYLDQDPDGDGDDADAGLFRVEDGGAPVLLADGVEDFQVMYGVDTDTPGDLVANRYVSAPAVTDWSEVVSVRLQLLLRSRSENLVDSAQNVVFHHQTFTATDLRAYRVFSTTVALRNNID